MSDAIDPAGFPVAEYRTQFVRAHRGNKFIEALPDPLDDAGIIRALRRTVTVEEDERLAEPHQRMMMVQLIPGSFMQPLTEHVGLAHEVGALIRNGYVTRNPESRRFMRSIGRAAEAVAGAEDSKRSSVAGAGMAIIGLSGVGKSTAVDEVLRLYPRVVSHPALSGPIRATLQIPWLKLTCPGDGSIKSLLRSFFTEVDQLLGTDYHRLHARTGTQLSMQDAMVSLCFIHGVGVLIIDEVQTLRRAKAAYAEHPLLRFFLTLRDVLQVPVVVVGTESARGVVGGVFQNARRHAGAAPFDRMKNPDVFGLFCNSLFRAYYLREPLKPGRGFVDLLHDLSAGVTDIAIKLFVAAQLRALTIGLERVDEDILQAVYEDCFELMHPFLDDLREGRDVEEVGFEHALRACGADAVSEKAVAGTTGRAAPARPRRAPRPAPALEPPKADDGLPRPREPGELAAPLMADIIGRRPAGAAAHPALRAAGLTFDLAGRLGI